MTFKRYRIILKHNTFLLDDQKKYDSIRIYVGPLAQLVEQQTLNLQVLGSIPRRPTRNFVCKSGGIGRRTGLRIQFPKGNGGSSPFSCTILKRREQVMTINEGSLQFSTNQVNQHFCYATITVPNMYVRTIYEEAALAQKQSVSTYGFSRGTTPLGYIKNHYKINLLEHVKEFLFKYFVISFLYNQIQEHKLYLAGEPNLHEVIVDPEHDAVFIFELSLATPIDFREWKNFVFKAPKRKNYKDIDRQVELFVMEEEEYVKNPLETIQVGDWVCFDMFLMAENNKPVFGSYKENVWIKIGNEEADVPFQELFVGKKAGDSFSSQHHCLQEYFSNQLDTRYFFGIIIQETIPQIYFSFEHFKHHFRLKTNKDVHQKLIEVFSYRNDLSQRRSMVEEALKLLLSKHHVEVPNYLVLRQQKLVLESVQHNPDYNVYKTQNNFKDTIKQLAAKQAKEIIFIDQLAHNENLKVSNLDIKSYLNLIKRARTKEFIYFNQPPTKIQGQEMPLPGEVLKKSCLREKTLNHVIYHLTRK